MRTISITMMIKEIVSLIKTTQGLAMEIRNAADRLTVEDANLSGSHFENADLSSCS